MAKTDPKRTEFGYIRTVCGCKDCMNYCRFVPSYLVPSDLSRMIPAGTDPLEWAETNLLASPGAMVGNRDENGQMVISRVPTLVPSVKEDYSCINLDPDGKCRIHEVAPFGCAFFSCDQSQELGNAISTRGLQAIITDLRDQKSLYSRIWEHLANKGLVAEPVEIKRARMKERLYFES